MTGNELLNEMRFDTNNKVDYFDVKSEKFKEIALSLYNLYNKKNRDYGDSFGRSVQKYGTIAGLTRISDKFNRLESLILNKEQHVNDESLKDTILDMASYCIMLSMEL